MTIQMFYNLETDGTHYLLSYTGNQPEIPEDTLPPDFEDKTDSFSYEITKDESKYWKKMGINERPSFMEILTRHIAADWISAFSDVLFVPILHIGNISGDIDKTQVTSAIIFNGWGKCTEEDWRQAIISTSKLSFLDRTTSTFTTSHSAALNCLSKYRYHQMLKKQQNDKYNLVSRMHHWYKNETEGLMTAAKAIIHDFVSTKKYNSRIPDFLVIPAFHIGRYKKATELLMSKYDLNFIMTLPMVYNDKYWTIMFPVMNPAYQIKTEEGY